MDEAGHIEPRAVLTSRELEVLHMTSLGYTNTDMAGELDVTVHAIKFHLASIYRKLGVINRTEAAAAYLGAPHRIHPRAEAVP